jgi:hypothetical protein
LSTLFSKVFKVTKREEMKVIMIRFQQWFQLLLMQGAIDGTHVHITKPKTQFAENYYYFKMRGYSIMA